MYRSPAPHRTIPATLVRAQRIVTTSLLALAATAALAVGAQHGTPAVGVDHSPRVCFSAANWGPAPDADRPCARITRVYEDGSVQVQVTNASGEVRFTTGIGALDR